MPYLRFHLCQKEFCNTFISYSVVCWLERWLSKAESGEQWRFDPNALSMVSGVTTIRLANLP